MPSLTTISVIIPTYNLSDYIENTLRSVFCQTVLPDEIVIIDDGSDDDTILIIERIYNEAPKGIVRLIRQERSGPGAARNRGILEAKGNWISFLDGDDIWLPDKIEMVKQAIAENPDVVIVTHDEYEVDVTGTETLKRLHTYYDAQLPLFSQLYRRCFLSTSCMTVKKDALIESGGFDKTLPSAQDYDMWLKLARIGNMIFIPVPLEKYILRPFSISTDITKRYNCLMVIAKRYFPHLAHESGALRAYFYLYRNILIYKYTAMKMFIYKRERSRALMTLACLPFELINNLFAGKKA